MHASYKGTATCPRQHRYIYSFSKSVPFSIPLLERLMIVYRKMNAYKIESTLIGIERNFSKLFSQRTGFGEGIDIFNVQPRN
jgi:hypothetical protein